MAEIRFNYGDKFTQTTDTNTGIGSTIPAAKLDVAGNTSAGTLRVSGIASLSSYQGFVNTKLTTNTEDLIVEAGQSGSISGEVVVSTGQTISVSTGATTGQGGIDSLKVYKTFMPPVGRTADRPTDVKPGMIYYNKDLKTIEFWDGNFWKQVDNTTRRGRGVFGGGQSPDTQQVIDFINIASQGNALNFGELTSAKHSVGAVSSAIRGVYAGQGPGGGITTDIEYLTIASQSNAIDFGDLTAARRNTMGMSSSTRGIFCGGVPAPTTVDYIEMATLGNAVSFGTATSGISYGLGCISNGVRGIVGGGQVNGHPRETALLQFTISSLGNGTKFGDLAVGRSSTCGCSNSTRGLILGGTVNGSDKPEVQSSMEFVIIASEGNGTIFGDLTDARSSINACASQTRGVAAGGGNDPITNIIDFVNMSTLGNAQDFGDLTVGRVHAVALSDSHGGLGGF